VIRVNPSVPAFRLVCTANGRRSSTAAAGLIDFGYRGGPNLARAALNDPAAVPAEAWAARCLIVHDDPELQTKLAGFLRRTGAPIEADTTTGAALAQLLTEKLRSYAALFLVIECSRREAAADPIDLIARLRQRAPAVPLFVFARSGDERCAVRAMKAGATDYWPLHSINLAELSSALLPLLAVARATEVAPPPRPAAPPAAPAVARTTPTPQVPGYQLLKEIARSSAATVYLARHIDLARQVALKIQPIKGRARKSDRQRFTRECEILSRLNHRSVADVIDFGITPEYLYLALEYFPCGSMHERLRNPVSEGDARNYARQIAEALQVVHAAGVLHRDVKPSNLMLTTDNAVVLIDFGSARAQLVAQDAARSTETTATPYYVCPEQLDGRDPDQRSDLYSMGIIFYEMLAGELPFKGNTLSDLFERHRTAAIPTLPAHLLHYQPLINRLLAKNPDERYASATQFLAALNAISAPGSAG
jgi:tRNA A-37 threonylcarbamoyl transferase component Bud32/ActR/RegA family two-component response regulator